MNSKEHHLLDCASRWLAAQGFMPQEKLSGYAPLHPDLVVKGPSGSLVVECKVAHAYRSKVFPALVGDAILRAQNANLQPSLLLAFMLQKLNNQAVSDLEYYSKEFYPQLNWFLLDENGSGMAKLSGLRSEFSLDPNNHGPSIRSASSSVRGRLFSPSNRRLLKMLLLPGIDSRYWGGPEKRPVGVVNLAKACGLSQPKASSFVKLFEDAGFIRRVSGEPKVVRHEELLEDWCFGLKQERNAIQPVRSMYGDSLEKIIERVQARHAHESKPNIFIGSHYACHVHGVGRSSVKSALLYVGPYGDSVMSELDLVADDSGSAAVWLVSRDYEAVRQGSVIIDGFPVSDILQCYLDVRRSRARGQEQADYIADNILMPHFRRMS